jgi:hypothetical protein
MSDRPNDFDEWLVTKTIVGLVVFGGVWILLAMIGVV